jgi:hypothetical protein
MVNGLRISKSVIHNCTVVLPTQADLDYMLYWGTAYNSPLPFFKDQAAWIALRLGVSEWEVGEAAARGGGNLLPPTHQCGTTCPPLTATGGRASQLSLAPWTCPALPSALQFTDLGRSDGFLLETLISPRGESRHVIITTRPQVAPVVPLPASYNQLDPSRPGGALTWHPAPSPLGPPCLTSGMPSPCPPLSPRALISASPVECPRPPLSPRALVSALPMVCPHPALPTHPSLLARPRAPRPHPFLRHLRG